MQSVARLAFGHELADFEHFVRLIRLDEANLLAFDDRAVEQAQVGDDAAERVVVRVEHHRLQRRLRIAARRRDARDDRREQFFDAGPGLAAARQHAERIDAERRFHFADHFVGPGVDHVDLVQDRHDFQMGIDGRVGVRHRLGFDSLRGVDQQQGPFAAGQTARHFVMEIDVPRRVDQVHLVDDAVVRIAHRDGASLDRDAPLALQVHVVEHLIAHLALAQRVGLFQQAVGQRALAVVDVRDDAVVADVLAVGHGMQFVVQGSKFGVQAQWLRFWFLTLNLQPRTLNRFVMC